MLDNIRLHFIQKALLDSENNFPQLLLVRLRIRGEVSWHGRTRAVKGEVAGVSQEPVGGDTTHFVGLNYYVPIGVQVADVIF